MAVAHLLHGRRGEHRIVVLRAQRRQVAQELRKVDPLLAEIADRKVVLLADVAEILLLDPVLRGHQHLELGSLAVAGRKLHDTPLDDRPVEFEIALVGVVVGRDLLFGEERVDRTVDVVLVQLLDQQRLPVLLDHLVDITRRRGEERLGLLELELFDDPAIDVELHEGGAVVARQTLGDHRADIKHAQLLAAGPGNGRVAGKIARQLPATRQEHHTGRDRYFRTPIHFPKGKDRFFTRK